MPIHLDMEFEPGPLTDDVQPEIGDDLHDSKR